MTGGHTKNPLLMRLYADTTGCTVVQPAEEDAVLLGTAMVAATAAGLFPGLAAAAAAMAKAGAVITPDRARRAATIATTGSSSRCTSSAGRWMRSLRRSPALITYGGRLAPKARRCYSRIRE